MWLPGCSSTGPARLMMLAVLRLLKKSACREVKNAAECIEDRPSAKQQGKERSSQVAAHRDTVSMAKEHCAGVGRE